MQQKAPMMNSSKKRNGFLKTLLCLGVGMVVWLAQPRTALAAIEETFDVLQIGTHTYKNVTVTTKAKNYVFILHSTGMTNVKVADLPSDIRDKLGYNATTAANAGKSGTAAASTWAKKTMASIQVPQLKQLEQLWNKQGPSSLTKTSLNSTQLMLVLAGAALIYILLTCCYSLICKNAGKPAGAMIWVPVVQLIPLLRAAGMSGWWFVGFLLPVINLVGWVLWCFKIAKACGKGAGVGLLLLLPVTSFFALLYLAFSGATATKKEEPKVEIMSLEVA